MSQNGDTFLKWDVLNGVSGQTQFYPVSDSIIAFNPNGVINVTLSDTSGASSPANPPNIHVRSMIDSYFLLIFFSIMGILVLIILIYIFLICYSKYKKTKK